jgi:DNA-binding transcriptional LysR family regulator
MLSIEQIEAFIATVDSGSFSAAARKLGKVQSAVSQSIMNLEIDCGIELFDRSGRYPTLNDAGHKLLPYARAVSMQHNRLNEQALSLSRNELEPVILAVDEGLPLNKITPIISKLVECVPRVQVECLLASTADIIEMVQSGRATTGLIFGEYSVPFSLDFENVGAIEFDIYVAADHPLAQAVSPHIEILSLHRQLVISSRNSNESSLHQLLSPDVWFSDSYAMLIEWCKAGLGWTFIPCYLAKQALEEGTLIPVPIEFEKISAISNVELIQHSSKSSDVAHKKLRELVKSLFEGM